MGHRIGIFGASGYAGGELIRLADGHPDLDVELLGGRSTAGSPLGDVHPHLPGPRRRLVSLDAAAATDLDLVFLALPHGASAAIAMELLEAGVRVVDLGSDFRLDSVERYTAAYGPEHPHSDQLGRWPYGLPELFRDDIIGSDRVAVPGCYPTSVILGLAPLLAGGLVAPGPIIVDSMSGVTGAGRGAKPNLTFGAIDEGVTAYGLLTHRHRPEMEMGLAKAAGNEPTILFTPHLMPMQRGILSTIHAPLEGSPSDEDLRTAFEQAYSDEPFVDVVDGPPQTRWVVGSNRCLISVQSDPRTASTLVLAVLDNLVKGAAGQAVQCANLMLGLDESSGLPTSGWMP
jgi:N-acetyl-gamma-glutamyl-phosphate reductase